MKKKESATNIVFDVMRCAICHTRVDHMKELKEVIFRIKDKDTAQPICLSMATLCLKCKTKYVNKEHLVIADFIEFVKPKDVSVRSRVDIMKMISKLFDEYDEKRALLNKESLDLDIDFSNDSTKKEDKSKEVKSKEEN